MESRALNCFFKISTTFITFAVVNIVFFFKPPLIPPVVVDTLQMSGGVIIAAGYVFQLIRITRRKSVKDISKLQLFAILIACMSFQGYAVYNFEKMIPFVITNTCCTLLAMTELSFYFIYEEPL